MWGHSSFGVLCLLLCSLWVLVQSRKFSMRLGINLPPPKVAKGVNLPPNQWFIQYLNHFDPTDSRQWKQKYYMNDEFYESGGPLFVMIGGEGPASPKWMVNGSWVDYARTFNAFLVQLEHRYYGESHPTRDTSVKKLKYLSSEQALADLAFFISDFKEQKNLTDTKVIVFGGSYPGSLALWLRMKYPHLVYAAISSSAPLVAQVDFKAYLDVVTSSILAKGSQKCLDEIHKSSEETTLLLQHRVGWKTLENLFNLCSPFNGSNEDDVSNFYENIAELFEDVVQYNEDNRDVQGSNITIGTICGIMTDPTIGSALQRTAAINRLHLKNSGQKCFDHRYRSMIKQLQAISWGNDARSWIYQTCTEFGFYQTSESPQQPFGNHFPLKFFLQQCSDIFGKNFSPEVVQRGVKRTNVIYGGKSPTVTRVILVNGSIDPWHYLGVTEDLNEQSPAIFINGTAHCANMYPSSPSDPPQLVKARQDIEGYINLWLSE